MKGSFFATGFGLTLFNAGFGGLVIGFVVRGDVSPLFLGLAAANIVCALLVGATLLARGLRS